jgi:gamma-glutamyltranspeptidase/glutathione hydrolase
MNNVTRICSFLILVGSLTSCAAPPVVESEPSQTMPVQGPLRPPVIGRNAGVSAGHPLTTAAHPLTTAAALEILQQGGNAFDAGVAALLVGGVVEQDLYGIGGEALILVYPQSDGKVTSITGQGWAAAAANVDDYLRDGRTLQGQGLDPWNAGER